MGTQDQTLQVKATRRTAQAVCLRSIVAYSINPSRSLCVLAKELSIQPHLETNRATIELKECGITNLFSYELRIKNYIYWA